MSLLDSREQTAAQIRANEIIKQITLLQEKVTYDYESIFNLLWGFDNPQAVLDVLGTDAVSLFEVGALCKKFIDDFHTINNLPLSNYTNPPYQYTLNNDGTVTLGNLIV